jgi:uncharacterized iron-regulated protein
VFTYRLGFTTLLRIGPGSIPVMKYPHCFLLFATWGCASAQPREATPTSAPTEEVGPDVASPSEAAPPVPEDAVLKAARPFSGYRIFDQKTLSQEATLTLLASADAICFGEVHDRPRDHYAELELVRGLSERRRVRGFELQLGLEMVRNEFQPNLDYFFDNPSRLDQLARKLKWEDEWGFPRPYYAPVIEEAGIEQVRMVALGVARQISRTVASGGIASLPETQRSVLPDLDLNVPEHRKLFDQAMVMHPNVKNPENYYQVQVIWDEAMAERSVAQLAGRAPARKMIILAGQQHCHRSAIPSRMMRRAPELRVVSVRVQDAGADNSGDDMRAGYDFELVF